MKDIIRLRSKRRKVTEEEYRKEERLWRVS